MTTALLVLTLCVPAAEDPPVRPDTRAAAITLLRANEHLHGKRAWTQDWLLGERAAVHDPVTSAEPLPGWAQAMSRIILDWFHLLLPAVVVGGAALVWRNWRRGRPTAVMLWSLAWFAVLMVLHLAVLPDPGPAAVVRLDATVLRQGNGLSYLPQLHQGLPVRLRAGAEAVVRTRRENGWVQLEFPTGVMGWVPQDTVYLIEERP